MALIFLASTDAMSAAHTSRFIVPFLLWINPDISLATLLQIHFLIRKGAHLMEYAVLAYLLARAAEQSAFRMKQWKHLLAAFAIASLYAASDEFHQWFVGSRGSSVGDVLIDISGAISGLLVFWIVRTLSTRAVVLAAARCGVD
jgi:VanZ family protein